jgi:hypothetical protein
MCKSGEVEIISDHEIVDLVISMLGEYSSCKKKLIATTLKFEQEMAQVEQAADSKRAVEERNIKRVENLEVSIFKNTFFFSITNAGVI